VTAGRVIVLSRDRGLATIAGQLVDHGQALTRFVSPAELPDWLSQPIGAVVLDFPRRARGIVYRQLRQRYRGPVLALLDPGETSSGLPTDRGRVDVLQRPFRGEQLSALLATLTGSGRDRARRAKARALTAPPVGGEPARPGQTAFGGIAAFSPAPPVPALGPPSRGEAIAASIGATLALPPPPARLETTGNALVGVGPEVTGSSSGARRRRRAPQLQLGAVGRHRLKGLAVTLGATVVLLIGITLSGDPSCRAAGCGIASAIGTGGAPPIAPGVSATPGATPPASGAGRAAPAKGAPAQAPAAPAPTVTIPIASGVGDLINGTSSSSGGAPLLVVGGGSGGGTGGGSTPPGGGGSGGGTGGGVPPATTRPPGTTSPPTTAPPTTAPPTTAPPTTAAPTTEPPTTAPPTTEPPTTAPPTTDPPTTAPPPPTTAAEPSPTTAASATSGVSPTSAPPGT
jgi:hypothetical protein